MARDLMLKRAAIGGGVVAALFIGWSRIDGSLDAERVAFATAFGLVFAGADYWRRRRREQA